MPGWCLAVEHCSALSAVPRRLARLLHSSQALVQQAGVQEARQSVTTGGGWRTLRLRGTRSGRSGSREPRTDPRYAQPAPSRSPAPARARCGPRARHERHQLRTREGLVLIHRTAWSAVRTGGRGNGIGFAQGIPFAPLALSLPLRWLCMGKAGAVCF